MGFVRMPDVLLEPDTAARVHTGLALIADQPHPGSTNRKHLLHLPQLSTADNDCVGMRDPLLEQD